MQTQTVQRVQIMRDSESQAYTMSGADPGCPVEGRGGA